jgi:thioredoxin-like negative regulator of GroEL
MHDVLRTAIEKHQAGQLGVAAQLYQSVLTREPDHAEALHLLGVLHHQQGQNSRAVELIADFRGGILTNTSFGGITVSTAKRGVSAG